jgi:hypothetical protein
VADDRADAVDFEHRAVDGGDASTDFAVATCLVFASVPDRPRLDVALPTVNSLPAVLPALCSLVPALTVADVSDGTATVLEVATTAASGPSPSVPLPFRRGGGCKRHGPFGCACSVIDRLCASMAAAVDEAVSAASADTRRRRSKWATTGADQAPIATVASVRLTGNAAAPSPTATAAKVTIRVNSEPAGSTAQRTVTVAVDEPWRCRIPVSDAWLSRNVALGKADTLSSLRALIDDINAKADAATAGQRSAALGVPTCTRCKAISGVNAPLASCGVCSARACHACVMECAGCRRIVCPACIVRRSTFDGFNAADEGRCLCTDCL